MSPASAPKLDRILFERDEGCGGVYRGLKITVWGKALDEELIAEAARAVRNAAADRPEGLAVLVTLRPDVRFPLMPSFASHFVETSRTLVSCLPHLRACAVVPMFDGFILATVKLTVSALNQFIGHKIPQRVFSSRVGRSSWRDGGALPQRVRP
jgi:hypothetical protein